MVIHELIENWREKIMAHKKNMMFGMRNSVFEERGDFLGDVQAPALKKRRKIQERIFNFQKARDVQRRRVGSDIPGGFSL